MGPVIVIPAYNPGRELLTLLDELALAISTKIIVVDDGSRPDTQYIFGEVALRSNVHLLRHGVNLGKGLALKTAFNFFLLTYADHSPGVITVDADGQHLVSDIYKVYYEFVDHPQSVVLGSRTFKEGVPFRSLFGNRMTSQLFHLLSGRKLSDTQTGLRSLPTEFLPKLMRLSGNGYDFETEVLILATQERRDIREVVIETVYIEHNSSSHFNPFWDSLKIYFVFLRFCIVSILTVALDYSIFILSHMLFGKVLLSFALARAVAGSFNFFMNFQHVFKTDKTLWLWTAMKFFALVLSLMGTAYLLTTTLVSQFGVNLYLAKVLVEGGLFFASFAIQNVFVFSHTGASQTRAEDMHKGGATKQFILTRKLLSHSARPAGRSADEVQENL